MDIIKATRELAKELQKTDEYTAFTLVKDAADNDPELSGMIGEFNLRKSELDMIMHGESCAAGRAEELNSEIRRLYDVIMDNDRMIAYNIGKNDIDALVTYMQKIIIGAANGEDPDGIEQDVETCGGDCSGCSGCH